MLSRKEMEIIHEKIREIAMSSAMCREERYKVADAAHSAIISTRGLDAASAEADALNKELKEVLGLKTPEHVRLTHGALGK